MTGAIFWRTNHRLYCNDENVCL